MLAIMGIKKALADGKRVLSREIVDEKTWQLDLFELAWSMLIRDKKVPKIRGELHARFLRSYTMQLDEILAGTKGGPVNFQFLSYRGAQLGLKKWLAACLESGLE